MTSLPLSLIYRRGAYTIKRAGIEALSDTAAEVRKMLQCLGMTEANARGVVRRSRFHPGQAFTFELGMNRLVIYTADGLFNVRDSGGKWHPLLDRQDVDDVATQAEIREAIRQRDIEPYPLPSYDPATALYFWPPDHDDLYNEEEITGDLKMIGWADDLIAPLLETARLCAQFGIL